MIILIAESKTMTDCSSPVAAAELAAHTPEFQLTAAELMHSWASLSVPELAAAIKISRPMAQAMREMILDFPDRSRGSQAIEAFTGVVFRALDYGNMTDAERTDVAARVRIISSLYGLLRPDDIIKAYRLDFTTRLAPGGGAMAAFWRSRVTDALLSLVAEEGSGEVLDLMPADAAKCIDMARVRKAATVCKVDFRTAGLEGSIRTPHANLLKTLRGQLLRQIVTENIPSLTALRTLASDATSGETITITV